MNRGADAFTALLIVAGLFVLTRPGSQGAQFVRAVTGGLAQLIGTATGQTTVASPRRVRAAGGGRRAGTNRRGR
jgi:hypothetical protein